MWLCSGLQLCGDIDKQSSSALLVVLLLAGPPMEAFDDLTVKQYELCISSVLVPSMLCSLLIIYASGASQAYAFDACDLQLSAT
jgi:hypothetical protein